MKILSKQSLFEKNSVKKQITLLFVFLVLLNSICSRDASNSSIINSNQFVASTISIEEMSLDEEPIIDASQVATVSSLIQNKSVDSSADVTIQFNDTTKHLELKVSSKKIEFFNSNQSIFFLEIVIIGSMLVIAMIFCTRIPFNTAYHSFIVCDFEDANIIPP
ncbi:MAG: hypothetical protein ACRCUP_04880 [Mycoplasmatales bacterium]